MADEKKKVERPLYLEEVANEVRAREALRPMEDVPLQFSLFAAAERQPDLEYSIEPMEKPDDKDGVDVRIDLGLRGLQLGQHAFPPKVELREF